MVILADGVRPQMEHRRKQYQEYLWKLSGSTAFRMKVHETHRQQAGMLKDFIDEIKTPYLLFCEHDATLDDKFIDWEGIELLLDTGDANTVRLYWNSVPHPEHLHLMGDRLGAFVKTTQWSSWPHISRVDFYKRILNQYFAGNDCKMIETVMYSPVVEFPWEEFKTWIYCPEGDGVRFHHHDGRTDQGTGIRDEGDW